MTLLDAQMQACAHMLADRIQKQKKHCWYANPAQIRQVIAPSARTWLYWRQLFLFWPEKQDSIVEHCFLDGLQPILSFGLTDKGVIAALIATPAKPYPVWIIPADFIQEDGDRLMKAAASFNDEDEPELRSAVVTAVHPHSSSQYAVGNAFKQFLEQSDVPWLYEPGNGRFDFY